MRYARIHSFPLNPYFYGTCTDVYQLTDSLIHCIDKINVLLKSVHYSSLSCSFSFLTSVSISMSPTTPALHVQITVMSSQSSLVPSLQLTTQTAFCFCSSPN
ncbi:Hypothetical_protein [Hexamita inflata]|uniref:Hypothetical_protein n=1 Tax=Hexamita inflata TaxID=28002 RepID=A0AA86Q3N4_9EUKA|nr:Hypothetical protein HINF_LOCUS39334 [Hexamita inflata]